MTAYLYEGLYHLVLILVFYMTGFLFPVHAFSGANEYSTTTFKPESTTSYRFGTSSGLSTIDSRDTTTSYGPPSLGLPTIGPKGTSASNEPPSFGPPTTGPQGTTAQNGPPPFGPPTIGPQSTTAQNGPPPFGPPTTGSQSTTAQNGPPPFGPPTTGSQGTTVQNGPPPFGPPTTGSQSTTAQNGSPPFGPPTRGSQSTTAQSGSPPFGPPTTGSQGTTAQYGPPSVGPPTIGPQGTTVPYGPPYVGPPTTGPQGSTAQYGPPSVGPPTIGPQGTTVPYGPPSVGPPTTGPQGTTTQYGSTSFGPPTIGPTEPHGPPTFGPPTIGPGGTTSPYGPPTFGPPPGGQYNYTEPYGPPSFETNGSYASPPSGQNENIIKSTTERTYNHPTDYTRPWINMPDLLTESFDMIDFIKSICPNTKSCRVGNETDASYEDENCCLTCDCSDDCFAKGTCCYDKEIPNYTSGNKHLLSSLKESCVFPIHGISEVISLWGSDKKSVLMVDHCHDNDLDISETCTQLNRVDLRSLIDLSPYYSPKMGVSFSNMYCALCNNAYRSLIPWNRIMLSCSSLKLFSSLFTFSFDIYTFLKSLEASDCFLEFHAPHENSVECIHQQSVVSECEDDNINQKLRDYCKNVPALYGKGSKIYKNIFCFGCNVLNQHINEYSCLGVSTSDSTLLGRIEGESVLSALETLLMESYNKSEEMTDTECENGFIYQQYLNQCMADACAPSKVNVSGKCVPVLKTLKNIGLDYKVKYRFVIGTADSNKYSYLTEVESMIVDNYNGYLICRRDIEAEASLQDFHVTYDITVTLGTRELTDIEGEFHKFKEVYNKTINGREAIKTSLDYEGYETIPFGQFGFVRYKNLADGLDCPETVAMVDLQFCDTVVFRINNGQISDKGFLRVKSMMFKLSEYLLRIKSSNDSEVVYAQICRDVFERNLEVIAQDHGGDDDDDNDNVVNGIAKIFSSSVLITTVILYTRFNVCFLLIL